MLSPGTRRIDEGEKLQAYLQINSLAAYIMFEQDFAAATVYRRVDGEFQKTVVSGLEAKIALPDIVANLPLAAVYANVDFQPEAESEA